jgi:sterol desaturase/sphingolipid hydroxylase (fatty acid hydroxylase superfamily)
MLFSIGLQIGVAWFYSHVLEYFLHKHVLHKSKVSKFWFSYHFGQHHFAARRNHMIDTKYNEPITDLWKDHEVRGLLFLGLLHFPVWFIFPAAYYTLLLCGVSYYMVHRACHRDHEWARNYASWHYDHHMAPNQHLNWGVRLPMIDCLLGTRKHWKGERKEIVSHVIGKNGLKEYVKTRSRRPERSGSTKSS